MTERENMLRVMRGETPAWLPHGARAVSLIGGKVIDTERPHFADGVDWFGVHWISQDPKRGIAHPDTRRTPVVTDITRWREQLRFPDIDAVNWKELADDCAAQIEKNSGKYLRTCTEHGIWERLTLLMGFENALAALLLEPEAVKDYAKAMADFKIAVIDRLLDMGPFDDIVYQDDLGSTKGLLMSPETWRDIFGDEVARIVSHVHSRGVRFCYHSCGRIDGVCANLAGAGIDMLNNLQACNDQAYIKRAVGGSIALEGGFDMQRVTGKPHLTEDDVKSEVRRVIDTLAPGGRFEFAYAPDMAGSCGFDVAAVIDAEFDRYSEGYYA